MTASRLITSMMIVIGCLAAALVSACRQEEPPAAEPKQVQGIPAEAQKASEIAASSPDDSDTSGTLASASPANAESPGDSSAPSAESASRAELRKKNIQMLRQIGNEMMTRWQKLGSVSAKIKVIHEGLEEDGKEFRQEGEGQRDMLIQPDGREMMRSEIVLQAMMPAPEGAKYPYWLTRVKKQKFSDGRHVYSIEDNRGGTKVFKAPARPPHIESIGGPAFLRRLVQMENLEHLPDTQVQDRDCYHFRNTREDGAVRIDLYIDKATGLRILRKIENDNRRRTYEVRLSDIEVGVSFPEDHFTFTPPEGVSMDDLEAGKTVFIPREMEQKKTGEGS